MKYNVADRERNRVLGKINIKEVRTNNLEVSFGKNKPQYPEQTTFNNCLPF